MINQRRLVTTSRLQKSLKRKSTRKRLIRIGLVAANVLVLGVVATVVFTGSHGMSHPAAGTLNDSTTANPVDGQTAYDIAANVARITDLPESTAIVNQEQDATAEAAVSASSTSVVAKPQILATALKSRDDIVHYTTVQGDTVSSLAQKFGVTSDSIKWSNGLTSDNLNPGTKLVIPPINGVVYTVKPGDTVQTIATHFQANSEQIVAYNDAEISGIAPGEQVLIPNGQIAQTAGRIGASGATPFSLVTVYAGNGYVFGYCTWYVYNERAAIGKPIGSNWGNAVSWAAYAAAAGYRVDHTPEVGAIQQNGGGLGHVAIVVAVNDDGSYTISEMNATAGWDRVDQRSFSAAQAATYNFIH